MEWKEWKNLDKSRDNWIASQLASLNVDTLDIKTVEALMQGAYAEGTAVGIDLATAYYTDEDYGEEDTMTEDELVDDDPHGSFEELDLVEEKSLWDEFKGFLNRVFGLRL